MGRTDHSARKSDLESAEISEVPLRHVEGIRSEHGDTTTETLEAVVAAAVGQALDTLDSKQALDVAKQLRAVVGALPTTSGLDARLAARLVEAAEMIERRTGIT